LIISCTCRAVYEMSTVAQTLRYDCQGRGQTAKGGARGEP
jgi:hypothetical protein